MELHEVVPWGRSLDEHRLSHLAGQGLRAEVMGVAYEFQREATGCSGFAGADLVDVWSRPGEGTQFHVWMPLAEG